MPQVTEYPGLLGEGRAQSTALRALRIPNFSVSWHSTTKKGRDDHQLPKHAWRFNPHSSEARHLASAKGGNPGNPIRSLAGAQVVG